MFLIFSIKFQRKWRYSVKQPVYAVQSLAVNATFASYGSPRVNSSIPKMPSAPQPLQPRNVSFWIFYKTRRRDGGRGQGQLGAEEAGAAGAGARVGLVAAAAGGMAAGLGPGAGTGAGTGAAGGGHSVVCLARVIIVTISLDRSTNSRKSKHLPSCAYKHVHQTDILALANVALTARD